MSARACVLLIGDEILSGVVRDANAAAIARALLTCGVPVVRIEAVGDDIDAIAIAARRLAADHEILVATGGLGPTLDDRTRDAFAKALGVGLTRDEAVAVSLRERACRLAHPAPNSILCQADRPVGTFLIENPVGSAPGFRGTLDGCAFWVLPGVPVEVRAMLDSIAAGLPAPPEDLVWECIVATAGLSEVRAALALEAIGFTPPEGADLGFLPGPSGVRIKLASRGGVARAAMESAEARVREALAGHAVPVAPLERAVLEELASKRKTLATAESCTGGLLGARLTEIPGSSAVYVGGVVAYANEAKSALLHVDPATIKKHGAVSESTAVAMAEGIRRALGASIGVSVTGVAGPGGGTSVNPVGSVWIGVADETGTEAVHSLFGGNREMIRERSVGRALELVWRRARGGSAPPSISSSPVS